VTVFLVGAGPGDPGLITVRGLELLRSCDVLVYDRLVSRELVDEAPRGALRIARDRLTQDRVNELLVAYGSARLEVVRLKGGDPFVFGRGGEEALALARAGVPFEVVPGVSALAAVPAAAGIPLTHRNVSSQVTIVNGPAFEQGTLDVDALARTPGTLVVFMPLAPLPRLAAELVGAGMDAATPAAVISAGTLPEQEVVTGTLGEIGTLAAGLATPALVVIGDVVGLADELGIPNKQALIRADAA
jgi:uroporphyrin-III C-methyltransferase